MRDGEGGNQVCSLHPVLQCLRDVLELLLGLGPPLLEGIRVSRTSHCWRHFAWFLSGCHFKAARRYLHAQAFMLLQTSRDPVKLAATARFLYFVLQQQQYPGPKRTRLDPLGGQSWLASLPMPRMP